ncbi:MAG: 2,3-bisphosphoglycerate-independent phosphoglycerate mutase, partial [Hydrogenoanaerobacterium sp.]
IGAGRVVFQDLPRISLAIKDGSFFENPAYVSCMAACKKNGTTLHILGLLSDGGVHSHISHIFALLDMAKKRGISKVCVHGFLDGRDVAPSSGIEFVRQCADKCKETGATLATVSGRYYAMDRDNRWERLTKAYNAMVLGEGVIATDPVAAVEASYAAGVTDEFLLPTV